MNSARKPAGGAAIKGSQYQLQVSVNQRQAEFSSSIAAAVSDLSGRASEVTWVSPLASQNYVEYMDADFLLALGLGEYSRELSGFWPKSGPRWDALARVGEGGHTTGVILVEAKSYPEEAYSGGCKAKSNTSLRLIENSLSATKVWLGVDQLADWTGRLYQYANRLAHLYFFREVVKTKAWLVNVYFANDPHRPTTHEEWLAAIPGPKSELGLSGKDIPNCCDLIIEAPVKE